MLYSKGPNFCMCHLYALACWWHLWKSDILLPCFLWYFFVLCKMIILTIYYFLEQDQRTTQTKMWSKYHKKKNNWIHLLLHTDVLTTETKSVDINCIGLKHLQCSTHTYSLVIFVPLTHSFAFTKFSTRKWCTFALAVTSTTFLPWEARGKSFHCAEASGFQPKCSNGGKSIIGVSERPHT